METIILVSAASAILYGIDRFAEKLYQTFRPGVAVPHNARWFLIHAVTNTYVFLACSQDLYLCLVDPDNALTVSSSGTYYALLVAILLHLYHVAMFTKYLTPGDKLHHSLMVGVSGPLSLAYPSRLTGAGLWFLTGFPGAVDYYLLWLVKIGALDRMVEKKVYVLISTWIRSPGCLLCCFISTVALQKSSGWKLFTTLANGAILGWNGQYYMMLTCKDYGRKRIGRKEVERTEIKELQ